MSLLTLCQDVAVMVGLNKPSSIINNTDSDAQKLLAIANMEGRALSRRYDWQLLVKETSFTTIAAGDQGAEKREENQGRQIQWEIAMRPGKRKALPDTPDGRLQERIEQVKASIRAKVEHPFRIIKNLFGMKKVSYRGLAKNTARLYTLFGLANLLIGKSWSARNAKNAC